MNELDPEHRPMAQPDAGSQAPSPLGSDSGGRGAEHGVRGGTGFDGDDPRDTRPDRATRFVETTQGILSYAQLAPLLAQRVTTVEIYPEVTSLLRHLQARSLFKFRSQIASSRQRGQETHSIKLDFIGT